ncbi:FY-rich, C-terminal [Dillenia turbinata]|uniref:FY-rich, C-terminal n=1 Tax=Dillenia turbinata TaxID=194707 RepID=A0AAN8YVL7_9MAGN
MMATKLVRVHVKEEAIEMPMAPPGFEARTSFILKAGKDGETTTSCSASSIVSDTKPVKKECKLKMNEDMKIKSLHRRSSINQGRYDYSSDDESDFELLDPKLLLRPRLPKGVTRGCSECSNCQKVTARWRPEDSCRPDLDNAPVFYPTEKEFEDTLNYIASIRPKAEEYGICRIVPPASWKPPCPLKQNKIWEHSKFATRVQRVDKLQNRDSMKKMSCANNVMRKKKRRCIRRGMDGGVDFVASGGAGFCEAETFGFEPGPEFTLDAFQKYANDFKSQYFRKDVDAPNLGGQMTILQEQSEPTIDDIEGEYWRIVEIPTEEIEVLYGADIETGSFGSGFPKESGQVESILEEHYLKSGWNLNNFPRLPGSVLSYESSDISGVLVPWLYVGMCFSSFCWHVEDHHLYSLNYMHWGAPKMWYGVPGKDAVKFEAAMRKHLPDLFEEQPDLLHKLVTQMSPSMLKSERVPVYRCVQKAGEFVLTFPRAYHSGFNCGFNCAEAVNVAPVDWLPHGQDAVELYREQKRRTSISHDKLLLGAAREAVRAHWELNLMKKNTSDNLRWKNVCGKTGILSKVLKNRVEMERVRREFLCNASRAVKMESSFDANNERECSVCLFDLHLSAAGCHCCPDKYACLNHAKQFCSCSWGAKFFLYRYDINELNILVDALEGKLSAVYRWAKLDLGMALSSYISRENLQSAAKNGKLSHCSEGAVVNELSSKSLLPHLKEPMVREKPSNTEMHIGSSVSEQTPLLQQENSVESALVLEDTMASYTTNKSRSSNTANSSLFKDEESVLCVSNSRSSACFHSQEDNLFFESSIEEEHKGQKIPLTGLSEHGDVILVSDDEREESPATVLGSAEITAEITPTENPETSKRLEGSDENRSPLSCSHSSSATCMKDEDHIRDDLGFSSLKSGLDVASTMTDTMDGSGQPKVGHKEEKVPIDGNSRSTECVHSTTINPSNAQNNLDKNLRQKGPRIAKIVRRVNWNVEPLEYGIVQSGRLWSNSQAIFPKGFKSRVKYINALDPTNRCYYISEVLDAGDKGPLFMVSFEQCPREVFVHISAVKCWEMVRNRVNQELTKLHRMGRSQLPPLQPPGSLDGLEMFGFTSPAIVQVIESMDQNHVCTEYWNSRPLAQIPQYSQSLHSNVVPNDQEASLNNNLIPPGTDKNLRGLLMKANLEELDSLRRILSNPTLSTADQALLIRLLDEEFNKRPR